VGGCVWPFLVCETICLISSLNKRDSSLLNSSFMSFGRRNILDGLVAFNHERLNDNRSVVMPLDVPGIKCDGGIVTSCVLFSGCVSRYTLHAKNATWTGLKLFGRSSIKTHSSLYPASQTC